MLKARWCLHLFFLFFLNRLATKLMSFLPSYYPSFCTAEEAAGLGILTGTSPLQHFFWGGKGRREGGREMC